MILTKRRDAVSRRGGYSVQVSLWLTAVGVAMVALNLRPPITAVSPLLIQIQRQEGFSSTVASLLVAVPIACFVAFSGVAPHIGRRLGLGRTIGVSLIVLLIGFGIRLIHATEALFIGTTIIGLAITLGNVLLPAAIKRDHPTRTGLLTGLYTMSLYLGAALAAGLTLPLQRFTGLDWRGTLGTWAVLAVVALLAWLPQLRIHRNMAGDTMVRSSLHTLWRQPLAWAVTVFFAIPALFFYTVSTWLPTILVDAGMNASRAGGMLSVINLAAAPSALLMSILVCRTRRQVWGTTFTSACLGIALLGLLFSRTNNTIVWMILFGIGLGAASAIGYSLPLLRSPDAQVTARLNAMSQISGYSLCALGPVLVGALHDVTGTWTPALILLMLLAVVQAASGFQAGRDRFVY